MMYSEVLKPGKDRTGSKFMTSLGLVIILVALVGLSNFLYNRYGISYMGYVTFILYILIGIYVYRRKIRKYQYSLVSGILVFETLAGKRNRGILRVSLDEYLYFCPLKKEKLDKDTKYKSYYPIFNRKSPNAHVIAFKRDNIIHRVIFMPSEKLVALIKKA